MGWNKHCRYCKGVLIRAVEEMNCNRKENVIRENDLVKEDGSRVKGELKTFKGWKKINRV